ncbi:MAG: nucleotidyltransferase family protein [Planctomycetes bacterium]|nr:nucleotidyltransferase family protein [Planctomycetota bacterium]
MMDREGVSTRFGRVILAAGQAARMGQPKALLPFGEQNVIELVFAAGAAVTGTSVVVVNPALADVLEAFLPAGEQGVELVVNADPASEQIDSLKLGLERLAALPGGVAEWFFIHPVDYPLVGEADYRALAEAAVSEQGEGADLLQPVCGERRGHPILCRGSLAGSFLELEAGQTARDVVRSAKVRYVPSANPGVVDDLDTPEDYSRLLAVLEGGDQA